MNLVETVRNIWAIEDLRKRVLFTFGLLAIYRLGAHIPTPGVGMCDPRRYTASSPKVKRTRLRRSSIAQMLRTVSTRFT